MCDLDRVAWRKALGRLDRPVIAPVLVGDARAGPTASAGCSRSSLTPSAMTACGGSSAMGPRPSRGCPTSPRPRGSPSSRASHVRPPALLADGHDHDVIARKIHERIGGHDDEIINLFRE